MNRSIKAKPNMTKAYPNINSKDGEVIFLLLVHHCGRQTYIRTITQDYRGQIKIHRYR